MALRIADLHGELPRPEYRRSVRRGNQRDHNRAVGCPHAVAVVAGRLDGDDRIGAELLDQFLVLEDGLKLAQPFVFVRQRRRGGASPDNGEERDTAGRRPKIGTTRIRSITPRILRKKSASRKAFDRAVRNNRTPSTVDRAVQRPSIRVTDVTLGPGE
jgi:hypothetical protein